MKRKIHYLLCCSALVGCLLLYVVSYILYKQTIVGFWASLYVPILLTLCSAPVLYKRYRWLSGTGDVTVNVLCHIYVVGAISYSAAIVGNFYLPKSGPEYRETVTVVGKEVTKREKMYRAGHRMQRTGKMIYLYYLGIRLQDGEQKEIMVSRQEFNKAKEGAPAELVLQKGVCGFPVLKKVEALK